MENKHYFIGYSFDSDSAPDKRRHAHTLISEHPARWVARRNRESPHNNLLLVSWIEVSPEEAMVMEYEAEMHRNAEVSQSKT